MSFLDVLDSIGTGQRAAGPLSQQSSPAAPKPPHPLSKPVTAKLKATVSSRPPNGLSAVPNGVKQKFNEALIGARKEPLRSSDKPGPSSTVTERKLPVNASARSVLKNPAPRFGSPASSSVVTKVPLPGSYAALMAEAKAAQEQKAKSEVGLIKHQATSKVRLSKSEKRKREDEEKTMKTKLGKQPQHNNKVQKRARLDVSKRPESSYKGTAKPAPQMSSYKGTAGLPSQHRPSSADARRNAGKKSTRYDEYLGTDEEDEGEGTEVAEMDDGYGSDASSDMEADAFDVEEEESRALREARADDAKEMALENKLKREKEERRRRLEALAKKRR